MELKTPALIAAIACIGIGAGVTLGAVAAIAQHEFRAKPKFAPVAKTPAELQPTRCVVYRCREMK